MLAIWISLVLAVAASLEKKVHAFEVAHTVLSNLRATDYSEWKASGDTPKDLFSEVKKTQSKDAWKKLCNDLTALDDENLALFEREVQNQRKPGTLSCRGKLLGRLARYWAISTDSLLMRHDLTSGNLLQKVGAPPTLPTLPSEERVIDTSSGPTLFDGGLAKDEIALTFDDGPHPTRTERVLEILKAANIRATFFDVGEMTKRHPMIARETFNQGHTVGSHSFNHPQLSKLALETAKKNILAGHQAVIDATGFDSMFFRFPYGARNKTLIDFVSNAGMASFMWNMDSSDWKLRNPSALLANVVHELDSHKGGIILFHDIQEQTVIVLPHVIEELRRRNYKTVVFVPQKPTQLP